MRYQLYYWPGLQGRGEFVRLALEEGAADYVDVATLPESQGGGVRGVRRYLEDANVQHPPFAPPFLRAGRQIIGQTANILLFLGAPLHLAPADPVGTLWTHQLQLTLSDLICEVHDTHHPLSSAAYYQQQKVAARRRARSFRDQRLPKYLGYFERVLMRNGARGPWLVGARLSYADLSVAQVVAGLRFAFPRAVARALRGCPRLVELHDAVFSRPRIRRYVNSARRVPFSNDGIFRHYPELDLQ